jgi:hypothetical protein
VVLNDVWRTIGDEVGFFYDANFDDVPSLPGVYAWFYPLRLLSKSPDALTEFVAQVQAALNYDSECKGEPSKQQLFPLSWWGWSVSAKRMPKSFVISEPLKRAWIEIAASEKLFPEFQQCLLKASILMPPLYVGKADNLNTRCRQHLLSDADNNTFHRRFEEFARTLKLPICSVRQLVFACVRTGPPLDKENETMPSPVHELLEGVMKSLCCPPYGVR